jgi:ArsR family metal-binding transcriptional regulator
MSRTSEQADPLIRDYRLELSEPPCIPGADTWNAKAILEDSIAPVLPYLNAALSGADYHHDSQVVIWKDRGHKHAFRPREISVAPVGDREEARRLIDDVIDMVNAIWKRRGEIEPSFGRRCLPRLMDIYRLLPGTNCKQCGYSSCMAYAAHLREGEADLSQCPCLSDDLYAENRKHLLRLLDDPGGCRND